MKNKEWKKYSSVHHLDNLETLKALFFKHSFGRHYHEGYALGIILEGSETYKCNKKINIAPKGSIVVVNPGEIHNGHASDDQKGWHYFMIYPHLSLIRKALAQLELPCERLPWFPETVIKDDLFARKLIDFMLAFEYQDSRLAIESHFLELLHGFIQKHGNFTVKNQKILKDTGKVKQVKEHIYDQYCESLSLESLAKEVGLSPYALLRLFKKQTGISPYLYQTGLRIQKAKHHLKAKLPMAETAAQCGFVDQSHMTKQFKKWMGITPGDYTNGQKTRL
ncbi:MAG: AraC family transcriptional regulator [Desulfobacteraceae bacterium]|nr:AraC family transcriptional regulator [Desulfobacteraceae bacterium]